MQKQKKNKIILGLTGSIGCGKTTVARMFRSADSQIIDADIIGHRLLKEQGILKKIREEFGAGILNKSGGVDRKILAREAFKNRSSLSKLNIIIHPRVIARIKELIRNSKKKLIILDAALLIEAGLKNMVDKLVVVTARRNQQIERAEKRSGLKAADIRKRINSQISQNKKEKFADFIIDNSGSIEKTKKQVSIIRREILAR